MKEEVLVSAIIPNDNHAPAIIHTKMTSVFSFSILILPW